MQTKPLTKEYGQADKRAEAQLYERNSEQGHQALAQMGWHSITIWECLLKPNLREQTLESVVAGLRCLCEKPLIKASEKFPSDVREVPSSDPRHTSSAYGIPEPLFHLAAEDAPEYGNNTGD